MTNEAIAAAGGPEALSDRQRRILEAVKRHIGKHGYPPSLRDIRDECRISSVSVVNYNLARLEEYGYLRRGGGRARGITLIYTGDPAAGDALPRTRPVPLLGCITDDAPLPQRRSAKSGPPAEWINVTAAQSRNELSVFAMRARSSATRRDLVPDDGVLVLHRTENWTAGERIVAWLPKPGRIVAGRIEHAGAGYRIRAADGTIVETDSDAMDIQARVLSSFVITPYASI